MNWKSTFILLLALVVGAPMLQAQEMDKDEKKKWKDVARNYRKDLGALKILVEEHDEYRDQVQQAQAEASQLRAAMDSKDRQLASYQQQVADLNNQILAIESAPPPPPQVNDTNNPIMTDQAMVSGIVFKVQIGAYEKNKLSSDMATTSDFTLEDAGNIQRVIVGQFRQHGNAMVLRDRLRQMGVSDAFIVAYQDGARMDVKEAVKMTGGE